MSTPVSRNKREGYYFGHISKKIFKELRFPVKKRSRHVRTPYKFLSLKDNSKIP